jgi:uncharacterized repeat protein (TIGR01451 family)
MILMRRSLSRSLVKPLYLESLEERAVPATIAPTIREATGATISSITDARDTFRVDLGGGTSAGVDGSFGGFRREINWDGVPESTSSPNAFPASFFNNNSPRGAVFSTPGTGFQVSSDGTSAPVNFGNLNATYSTSFVPFTASKLFTPIGSNVTDVNFFLPGTGQPALVRGFGGVFSDVDLSNISKMEFFDFRGNLILERDVLSTTGTATYSFLGISFSEAIIAKVRITTGNSALSASSPDAPASNVDVVALDDFIYSEPIRFADLVITQSGTAIARQGDTVNYTINVANNGPNAALGARILDQFSSALSNISWTTTTTGGAVAPATGLGAIDTAIDLPVGSSIVFTVTATLNQQLTSDLVTSAVVLSPSNVIDPEGSNNTALAVTAYNRTPPGDRYAVGTLAGTPGRVTLYNQSGIPTLNLQPYGDLATGINVATGDINGDGIEDVITVPKLGVTHVKAYDGATGNLILSFFAYAPVLTIGASVAVADINNDGRADIITGAGATGAPHVKVFSGVDGSELSSFFVYTLGMTSGVVVAAGDINGDGRPDILTVPGAGAAPHIKGFSGVDQAEFLSFFPIDPANINGISLATGDFEGFGIDSILIGLNGPQQSFVSVYGGANRTSLTRSFVAYSPAFLGGVSVSSIDVDGDGIDDILTAAGPTGGPHVQAYNGASSERLLLSYFAFEQNLFTGLSIG